MSSLKDTMQADLTTSMRARDELRTATLRMTLSAIKSEEVAGTTARELSDDEVLTVVTREMKKRREAAEAFAGAGRLNSAEREKAESAVLQSYLPAAMSDEELTGIVTEEVAAAAATGATGPAAMGAVMKGVKPRVGKQAEGGRVAAEVKRQLQG